MTNEHEQEELSALMDGELDRFAANRVLDRTLNDPLAIERWKHYHLISDTLQHGLDGPNGDELRDRVRAALQERPPATEARPNWLKPVAGFALAASVAVVAVLGVRSMDNSGTTPGTEIAALAPVPQTVVDRIEFDAVARVQQKSVLADQQRLNRYLVEHAELASGSINGALPYARIVSYGVSR